MARHNKGHGFSCPLLCVISAKTPMVRPSFDGLSLMGKDIVANLFAEMRPLWRARNLLTVFGKKIFVCN